MEQEENLYSVNREECYFRSAKIEETSDIVSFESDYS